MSKGKLYTVIFLIISVLTVQPVLASSLADLKKQQKEAQDQLNSVSGKIGNIEGQKDRVEEEISDIDAVLVETLASISIIEEEIAQKQLEIEQAKADYEAAKAKEESQYEAMKMRIQFMYEKGETSYIELLFESKSITDMLNKADYIEQLYEYDRRLLEEFQQIRQEVADLKAQLEAEEDELQAAQHEYEEEKEALDRALAVKKKEADNFETQLAKAKQEAAAYKTMIQQQTAKIKQLEAEEAKKKAAQNKGTGKSVGRVDASIVTNATGSALGKEIATYGLQFVGYPYVAGGTSLTEGADCSGFTYAVYKAFGYKLPRNSTDQRSVGREVSYSEAEPGDLICYAGHVGMYIGGGMIVHASTVKTGIKTTPATYKTILSVRRIV